MSGEKEEGTHGEEWKQLIPPGFRFCPTDQEMLQHYLLRHVTGKNILPGIIREVDVYERNPYHLPGMDMREEFTYFFTERGRKYVNGSRTDRITRDGKGHWKSTSKLTKVLAEDRSYLGKKNTLVYFVKNSGDQNDIKTNWIMHEFVIANKLVSPSTSSALPQEDHYNDVVACRIYERQSNKNKRETEELKKLINSLIGLNPFTIDHNNGEPQPSLKRKFESNEETLIICDQPHDTAMNSNYLYDSQELQVAVYDSQELQVAATLGNVATNYEIGQTSNTTSTPAHDNIVVTGEWMSEGPSDQASMTVYQSHSDEVKIEENNSDLGEFSGGYAWDIFSRSPPHESFNYMNIFGI